MLALLAANEHQQEVDARDQFGGDALERALAHLGPLHRRWIREALMDLLRVAGEDRAILAGEVADGDDVVNALAQEQGDLKSRGS
jgi:hypothetical protein